MTEGNIKNGFLHPGTPDIQPPKLIRFTDEYCGEAYLNISIGTHKDMKGWLHFLPTLTKVKFLWVRSTVSQQLFDTICTMKNLIGLHIAVSSIKDINYLTRLEQLNYLHLGNTPKINNINALSSLVQLRVLKLENLRRITDFNSIGQLNLLERLSICGSIWHSQKIDTLQPFSGLHHLEQLVLAYTRIADKSLYPLTQHKLQSFNSQQHYSPTEYINNSAALLLQ